MLYECHYVLPQDKLALHLFEDCLVVGSHQHGHIFKLTFCLPQHTVSRWKIQMDTLGIDPRASRMLSGCDTTTPRAPRFRSTTSKWWRVERGCYRILRENKRTAPRIPQCQAHQTGNAWDCTRDLQHAERVRQHYTTCPPIPGTPHWARW